MDGHVQEVTPVPTAQELSAAERQAYVRSARARLAPRGVRGIDAVRRSLLLAKARSAAALLRQSYGATRVVLFGSLAHRAWLDPGSDVDLAVEGVAAAQYWQAWAAVESHFASVGVDLVDLADASPSLRREIERQGIDL